LLFLKPEQKDSDKSEDPTEEEFMLGGIGAQEILLILLIILLLFGARKIPEIARGLGKSMSEFKKGLREVDEEIKKEEEPEKREPPEKKDLAG
jgi:sec-independent protein translocase protein TatA